MKILGKKKESRDKVINFMGGISYKLNPIDTLKLITASSIFGEPAYYRDGEFAKKWLKDAVFAVNDLFAPYVVICDSSGGKKTSEIMEEAIDEALSFDFGTTVSWAETLRHEYGMRLNPQVIMVRAARHPGRRAFTDANRGGFGEANQRIMSRADEPASQLAYWLFKYGSKKGVPSVLKRSWAKKLSQLSRYELYKYKNSGIGLIDAVRISHAKGPGIDELMKTGTVEVKDDSATWEALRSSGRSWAEITERIDMPHMALLRNLRGIFEEINDGEFCQRLLEKLKNGVKGGKQFPFRYWSAMKAVSASEANHKTALLDALEECVDIAAEELPKLKGKTMCLSDNSGSAWGAFNSEYGRVTVAEIDNLSSVITAINSEEGYVGKFGDRLIVTPILKRRGILGQSQSISNGRDHDVGGNTENGVWIFFNDAIEKSEHWDNIFIYSDQQAGHGGLYGTDKGIRAYTQKGYAADGRYVDVAKLAARYRESVNPKVNVFSVQTAGYNNVCLPEYGYRTNIMYGWTGKELQFAKTVIDFWDELDGRNANVKS
ncbi:MAG: TROVE domain-containing protein [Synergistaceae bacterium]|nr:TROVE domain-containing protein [Synergistaceae bacterium]